MKYPICPYCASEQKIRNGVLLPKCDFCGADLRDKNTGCLRLVSDKGERFNFQKMKTNIFEEHAMQSVEILKTYHSFDLYILLKEIREKRELLYMGYEIFLKAAKQDIEFEKNAEKELLVFNDWTRRMYVIENILIERQGYFPSNITDKVLQYMWDQMKHSKQNKMIVHRNNCNEPNHINTGCV